MKLPILFGLLSLLITTQSHAMSKSLRSFEEDIYQAKVEKPTEFRAQDGSIVKVNYGDDTKIKHISIRPDKKKGHYLLMQVNGKIVPFKISGDPERIKASKDFYGIQILSISSGQEHSISFAIPHIDRSEPNISHRRESCTIYRTETQCYVDKETHKRECRQVDISTTGYREVEVTFQLSTYTTEMSVRNKMGQVVITGDLMYVDSDEDRNEGPCYAGSY